MSDRPELLQRIHAHTWFHAIDLGGGLVTNGDSPARNVLSAPGAIPDVRGKSVLDVGTWDGKYAFEAEAAGAARVVGLDHYVWRLDGGARQAYYEKCGRDGVLPDPDMIDNGFLVDGTPGKAGFDMAHEYLRSNVEAVVGDFVTMDLDALGQFDVVFYFGVLYHMVDPIAALKRLRRVTKGVAVIETAGIEVPGARDMSLVGFYPGAELNGDYGNWFAPSAEALKGMCRAAGFREVEITARTSANLLERLRMRYRVHLPVDCRLVAHAYA